MTDVSTVPASTRGVPLRRRTLLVMIGDEVDARPLPPTGDLVVGRGRSAEIAIAHPSVSRAHLRLALGDGVLRITDLGGANGTFLRGVRLPSEVAVEIAPNEMVQVGDVQLVVQEVGVAAAPTAPAAPRASGTMTAAAPALVLDPSMKRLYELGARVARGTIGVLLVGETGAGKEMLADHIHRSSRRAAGPLVRVNCAALTDTLAESELFGHERGAFTGAQREHRGFLEIADGGTLFLDELGELGLGIQAKLLRVVEDRRLLRVGSTVARPIDVRFLAATNRDLEADAEAGRFRRDLYFRLAGAVLAIPPLRERPGELAALAHRFATPLRVDDAALAALQAHRWPGNVRELRNVIERAALVCDGEWILADHLGLGAAAPPARGPLIDELAALERDRILRALEASRGNQTRAAAALGIPLRTFVKRLDEYGLPRPRRRRD